MVRELQLIAASILFGASLCYLLISLISPRISRKRRVVVKYHSAVHEAGHALAVLKSDNVRGEVSVVTTVPDGDSSGKVTYSLLGLPMFVKWEQIIVSLGGAAGEYVARGVVDPRACSHDLKDALTRAEVIVREHKVCLFNSPVLNTQSFYRNALNPHVLSTLNICMSEAIRRVRENEGDFYLLVDSLLERRELTGSQVADILSRTA